MKSWSRRDFFLLNYHLRPTDDQSENQMFILVFHVFVLHISCVLPIKFIVTLTSSVNPFHHLNLKDFFYYDTY